MIRHYLELAWQQLEKYRLQSVVSIVSLAIGFACFSLATMWIKYETSYDAFHRDADRMCFVAGDRSQWGDKRDIDWYLRPAFCDSVYKHCPEIVEHTVLGWEKSLKVNEKELTIFPCDSNFINFFDIKILEGGGAFLEYPNQVAITKETAQELWGDESPLGKELIGPEDEIFIVSAVVKGWGTHTNIPFDLLRGKTHEEKEGGSICHYIVRLAPNTDLKILNQRLNPLEFLYRMISTSNLIASVHTGGLKFIPATEMRHHLHFREMAVQIDHIYLFACAGALLILCGLLNYLTMFINRLFIRQREIALRTVFGAKEIDLTWQFLIEYGLVLVIAFGLGIFIMNAVLPPFRHLAELPEGVEYVYREGFIYLLVVLAVSLLISLPVIRFFRRQALQDSIQSKVGLFSYNNFRKLSTCLQICISIMFLLCTVVMMKQIYTLRHVDKIGFAHKNTGLITIKPVKRDQSSPSMPYSEQEREAGEAAYHYISQQPEITTILRNNPIFPLEGGLNLTIGKKDFFGSPRNPDLVEDEATFRVVNDFGGTLTDFYQFQLIKGRMFEEGDMYNSILINETAARQFHWENPVGKSIVNIENTYTIVGVVKDFMNVSPTTRPKPYIIKYSDKNGKVYNHMAFKYNPGTWVQCKAKLEQYFSQNPSINVEIKNSEEEYNTLLESEKDLITLLSITAGTCILIALFGVWSMIMLTCEQRRKEIAIRKVFGATTKDILDMFFIEYMSLQGIAALVAFPIGYACMKPWLEQYVVQTEISWWIYVGIFLVVALLVALCVGWRVWKTAKARPADEICKG